MLPVFARSKDYGSKKIYYRRVVWTSVWLISYRIGRDWQKKTVSSGDPRRRSSEACFVQFLSPCTQKGAPEQVPVKPAAMVFRAHSEMLCSCSPNDVRHQR